MPRGKRNAALFEVMNAGRQDPRRGSLRTPSWWYKNRAEPARPGDASPDGVVDLDAQRLNLRVSFTTAAAVVFGVLLLVFVAYRLGSGGEAPSEPIARDDPLSRAAMPRAATPPTSENAALEIAADPPIVAAPNAAAPPPEAPVAAASPAAGRQVGLNYVIIQIYPDEPSAREAQDVLLRAGVQTTIERGLPGWAASRWFCVVGTRGFERLRGNPEYDGYIRAIETIGAGYARNSKFKQFKPSAYRWRAE